MTIGNRSWHAPPWGRSCPLTCLLSSPCRAAWPRQKKQLAWPHMHPSWLPAWRQLHELQFTSSPYIHGSLASHTPHACLQTSRFLTRMLQESGGSSAGASLPPVRALPCCDQALQASRLHIYFLFADTSSGGCLASQEDSQMVHAYPWEPLHVRLELGQLPVSGGGATLTGLGRGGRSCCLLRPLDQPILRLQQHRCRSK